MTRTSAILSTILIVCFLAGCSQLDQAGSTQAPAKAKEEARDTITSADRKAAAERRLAYEKERSATIVKEMYYFKDSHGICYAAFDTLVPTQFHRGIVPSLATVPCDKVNLK